MKKIYKKYCNDIQNPALGAYLIFAFVETFGNVSSKYPNLLDIFIFIPLIMVKDSRELIFWYDENNKSHKITKMEKLYEKIGYIGKAKNNCALGTANGIIIKFREYIISSIIFGIDTKMFKFELDGIIKPLQELKKDSSINEELDELISATTNLATIYAKSYDINMAIKNLEVIL